MPVATTLRELSLAQALAHVEEGAAFIDLRRIEDYVSAHIPGSLALLYEFGPGMATRARDCLPLALPLVLLDSENTDLVNAAASLRGKGFSVIGTLRDPLAQWSSERRPLATTDLVESRDAPWGTILDVGDPGTPTMERAVRIPIERLWSRAHELAREPQIVVATRHGVRGALAVGMLERAGASDITLWRVRD